MGAAKSKQARNDAADDNGRASTAQPQTAQEVQQSESAPGRRNTSALEDRSSTARVNGGTSSAPVGTGPQRKTRSVSSASGSVERPGLLRRISNSLRKPQHQDLQDIFEYDTKVWGDALAVLKARVCNDVNAEPEMGEDETQFSVNNTIVDETERKATVEREIVVLSSKLTSKKEFSRALRAIAEVAPVDLGESLFYAKMEELSKLLEIAFSDQSTPADIKFLGVCASILDIETVANFIGVKLLHACFDIKKGVRGAVAEQVCILLKAFRTSFDVSEDEITDEIRTLLRVFVTCFWKLSNDMTAVVREACVDALADLPFLPRSTEWVEGAVLNEKSTLQDVRDFVNNPAMRSDRMLSDLVGSVIKSFLDDHSPFVKSRILQRLPTILDVWARRTHSCENLPRDLCTIVDGKLVLSEAFVKSVFRCSGDSLNKILKNASGPEASIPGVTAVTGLLQYSTPDSRQGELDRFVRKCFDALYMPYRQDHAGLGLSALSESVGQGITANSPQPNKGAFIVSVDAVLGVLIGLAAAHAREGWLLPLQDSDPDRLLVTRIFEFSVFLIKPFITEENEEKKVSFRECPAALVRAYVLVSYLCISPSIPADYNTFVDNYMQVIKAAESSFPAVPVASMRKSPRMKKGIEAKVDALSSGLPLMLEAARIQNITIEKCPGLDWLQFVNPRQVCHILLDYVSSSVNRDCSVVADILCFESIRSISGEGAHVPVSLVLQLLLRGAGPKTSPGFMQAATALFSDMLKLEDEQGQWYLESWRTRDAVLTHYRLVLNLFAKCGTLEDRVNLRLCTMRALWDETYAVRSAASKAVHCIVKIADEPAAFCAVVLDYAEEVPERDDVCKAIREIVSPMLESPSRSFIDSRKEEWLALLGRLGAKDLVAVIDV